MQHVERELKEHVLLCDEKGLLNPKAIGYSKYPFVQSNLRRQFMKKKRWNSWTVFGEDVALTVLIAHFDYAAIAHLSFFHFETQRYISEYVFVPFGRKVKLSEHVHHHASFHHAHATIDVRYEQRETKLRIQVPHFDSEALYVNLTIAHPERQQSMNVVVPTDRSTFQFSSKHFTLPTKGTIQLGRRRYELQPYYSFAISEVTRGVWSRNTKWNWGAASQRSGDDRIGLNLGNGWTDGKGVTENGIFLNGKLSKIHEDVIFTYDTKRMRNDWRIETKFSNRVDLSFTPFHHNYKRMNVRLGRIHMNRLYGYYNGVVRLEDGTAYRIRQMLGSVESVEAKW